MKYNYYFILLAKSEIKLGLLLIFIYLNFNNTPFSSSYIVNISTGTFNNIPTTANVYHEL